MSKSIAILAALLFLGCGPRSPKVKPITNDGLAPLVVVASTRNGNLYKIVIDGHAYLLADMGYGVAICPMVAP